jgi:hypothetical protein
VSAVYIVSIVYAVYCSTCSTCSKCSKGSYIISAKLYIIKLGIYTL